MTLEINLLPRLTPYQKYRPLIFLSIGFTLLLLVIAFFAYYVTLNSQIASVKKELDRAKGDNVVLKAERAVSKELRLYYDIKTEVENLHENEQQYAKILDSIAAKLSAKTEVFGAVMNVEGQTLDLDIRAESIDVIADFAALIREEPWVKEVFVDRIRNNSQGNTQNDPSEEEQITSDAYVTKVTIQLEPAKVSKEKETTGEHSTK